MRSISMLPALGAMKLPIMLSSVLLPQPLGPTMQTNSPFATVKDTSPIAHDSRVALRYALLTCATSIMQGPARS